MLVAVDSKRSIGAPGLHAPFPEVGFQTHMGLGRHANEDAGWMAPNTFNWDRAGRLMAVADGMGGHKGGGFASRYACTAVADYYHNMPRRCSCREPAELCRRLTDIIYRVDRGLRLIAGKTRKLSDMGTTLACLVLTPVQSIIGHVGDSRIYRWRRGRLCCLTTDHTFVQEMIAEGEIDPQAADHHPLRHLLTQAVGTAEPLEHVFARVDPIWPGDRFLLCTDGLHNAVPSAQISDIMGQDADAGTTASNLIQQALDNRTRDNVTVLVARVAGACEGCPAATEESCDDNIILKSDSGK